MDDDLKQLLETMWQENAAAHADTRRQFEMIAEDLQHRMQIVTEDLQHQLQVVAEGFMGVTEKIDRLDERFGESTTELNRRVTRLEAKSSRH